MNFVTVTASKRKEGGFGLEPINYNVIQSDEENQSENSIEAMSSNKKLNISNQSGINSSQQTIQVLAIGERKVERKTGTDIKKKE